MRYDKDYYCPSCNRNKDLYDYMRYNEEICDDCVLERFANETYNEFLEEKDDTRDN